MVHFMRCSNSFSFLMSNYVVTSAICKRIYQNISSKCLHSSHQYKQEKPFSRFSRKLRKGTKGVKKEEVNLTPYTRDTVRNIYNILRNCSWGSAQGHIETLPIRWDSYLINQVLKTHPPLEKAWLFFNWASRLQNFKHDHYTYTTMLDIFGEAGRISSMNYVFQQMKEKGIKIDAVTYTSLMHWRSNSGDVDGAIRVWEEMKANGCYPTVVSYTAYIKILLDNGRVRKATDTYKEMLQSGLSPNCCTYTVLMEYLIGEDKGKEALDIFHKMQDAGVYPDKAACNILIQKCCKSGEMLVMTQILEYMKEKRLVLRYPVFVEAHEILKSCSVSITLLSQVNPHIEIESVSKGEVVDVSTSCNVILPSVDYELVANLLKEEKLIAVDHILIGMKDKNIQLDSSIILSIIEVNCKRNRPNGALLAFDYCLKNGVKVERNLYLTLIGVLIRSSIYSNLLEIVQDMYTKGHCLGLYHATLILYRLGKAGKPQYARKVFNMLPEELKCTATYTALVAAYFSAGSFGKGLKIYETMRKKGFTPSLGTYNVLLSGLVKSDRVVELDIYRREKKIFEISHHSHHGTILEEERICDLLFGELVS
ncbi:pentatricopeptide repeat-containing protein At2g01390 [Cucurbita maxima]|uniref:Pentatricopeptide repeat-containing protein At2g01390 n=1 Tax=Cucurbita maxima TaxID=3661 RepID=A0A6J1I9C5_CUCMA|nr:pentatricopeptide repeat-containing protein At2g01390 [Cucurbita maxima]XP_022971715.1 pentatricopeptide repeat-containing protein At2g01390 [Cucurbita maxima]